MLPETPATPATGAEADGAANAVAGLAMSAAICWFFASGKWKPFAGCFVCPETLGAAALAAELLLGLSDWAKLSESVVGATVVGGRGISCCLTLAFCCRTSGEPPCGRRYTTSAITAHASAA